MDHFRGTTSPFGNANAIVDFQQVSNISYKYYDMQLRPKKSVSVGNIIANLATGVVGKCVKRGKKPKSRSRKHFCWIAGSEDPAAGMLLKDLVGVPDEGEFVNNGGVWFKVLQNTNGEITLAAVLNKSASTPINPVNNGNNAAPSADANVANAANNNSSTAVVPSAGDANNPPSTSYKCIIIWILISLPELLISLPPTLLIILAGVAPGTADGNGNNAAPSVNTNATNVANNSNNAVSTTDLHVQSLIAVTAPAQPDTESIADAHLRIGAALAGEEQLQELRRASESHKCA